MIVMHFDQFFHVSQIVDFHYIGQSAKTEKEKGKNQSVYSARSICALIYCLGNGIMALHHYNKLR